MQEQGIRPIKREGKVETEFALMTKVDLSAEASAKAERPLAGRE